MSCRSIGIFIVLGPALLAGVLSPTLFGQEAAPSPGQTLGSFGSKLGRLAVSGSLRTRVEAWDWFNARANDSYAYNGSLFRLGVAGDKDVYDWRIELALPVLLGLPSNSVAPGVQGQLGFGGTYFAANSGNRNAALPFLKQGFLRLKGIRARKHQSVRFGRMELSEGAEIIPQNSTLSALKRDRIAQRLIGNFGFTHVGRSFDGVQYVFDDSKTNVTLFGARPTRGVFQVDGWGELSINVFSGSVTREVTGQRNVAEWRLFGIGYSDYRDATLKTDNRPLSARQLDRDRIHLATAGGHFLQVAETSSGIFDFLFWGALQGGSWGRLAQRAGAVAVEAGWQPAGLPKLRPWVRGGFDYGSGDGNPEDRTHGTFFQLLPTPRGYARFPFYNLMNVRDAFGEIILRPYRNLTLRVDVHSLRLANRNDLWYLGGGAFQPWTFGYTGRPSGGNPGLATLYDASADYAFNPHIRLNVYYGHATGKSVVEGVYPNGQHANFGFVELTFRF
jgi:hypothetical protein